MEETRVKQKIELILCIFGGIFGLHKFYVGKIGEGILYLFTGGLFLIGWIKDIYEISLSEESKEKRKMTEFENAKWKKVVNNFFLNEEYQKVRIYNREVNFIDLIDAELIEDGQSIAKTTGTNITKGTNKKHVAPIKGLIGLGIAGPVGAIIGGTSGKAKVKSKTKVNTHTINIDYCTNLSIKITVKDINNPIIMYRLINYKIDKNSFAYKKAYENAQKCIATIQAIINNQ